MVNVRHAPGLAFQGQRRLSPLNFQGEGTATDNVGGDFRSLESTSSGLVTALGVLSHSTDAIDSKSQTPFDGRNCKSSICNTTFFSKREGLLLGIEASSTAEAASTSEDMVNEIPEWYPMLASTSYCFGGKRLTRYWG
ncbi:hypothetical protein SERLA73DRAFT_183998 [Serpula lacrymans var. lacrymans S7.3]|uniref:Uncharacterized protein n=1 Tax=Serpula lacrymans var. lacrymans (strain S7.3) TaxID=936435 RepID=F8Q2A7_SERL3|nr:hypothetical protein SERLA73DRAFT_183998 [Serpula lacrymans var. lacrymans S7.3]